MTITRREFVKAAAVGGAALTLPSFFQALAKTSKGAERLNIVWLDSEDNCPDISPYGESLAHTPNLDRCAREGATYTPAYAPCPVCSPARSAYITGMTGMYLTSIGAQNHCSHRRDYYPLKPPVKPIEAITVKQPTSSH
jgi:anaerobic selenocysteine-containing dehydrogenase